MSERLKYLHFEIAEAPDGGPLVLGRGAMGVTYKATDSNLHCPVALKVIAPALLESSSARDRFLREARTAAALRHPNVATVLYLGEADDEVFYAMEFVEGVTLEEMIKQHGPLPAAKVLEIGSQVAKALSAAHRAGLVHRDIKPSNIMLVDGDPDAGVKLIDFGLAKLLNGDFTGETLAIASAAGFQGTPHFASPEQINGEDLDIRSDIYSLGVSLFAALTGKVPFGGSLAQVMARHLSQPPPLELLPDGPGDLKGLLAKMLAKDPSDRFQTPTELRAALDEAQTAFTHSPLADTSIGMETAASPPLSLADISPGVIFAGKYRLEGGMAMLAHTTLHKVRRDDGKIFGIVFFDQSSDSTGGLLARLQAQVDALSQIAATGIWKADTVEYDRGLAAVVGEWIDGPVLLELMKRRRALSLEEALPAMQKLGETLDALAVAGRPVAALSLGDVLITPPGVLETPLNEVADLRPLILPFRSTSSEAASPDATLAPSSITPAETLSPSQTLALLTYEVLGGMKMDASGRWTPLPALSAYGNSSLRQAIENPHSFSSAADFLSALQPGAKAPKRVPLKREPLSMPTTENSASRPSHPLPAKIAPPMPEVEKKAQAPFVPVLIAILVIAVLVVLAVVAGGAFWFFRSKAGPQDSPSSVAQVESTPAPAAASATPSASPTAPPPDPAAEFMNAAMAAQRQDDLSSALTNFAKAADVASDPTEARQKMEMVSAALRSNSALLASQFPALRPALELAAAHDVVSAQMILGEKLRRSEPQAALNWFSKAAALGQTEAMTQAGLMMANGLGRNQPNFSEAVAWFQQGAAGGDTDAMVALADCQLNGKGTARNIQGAVELLRTASALNHAMALNMLGDLVKRGVPDVLPQNYDEAFALFSKSMDLGNDDGQANVGVMYVNGWGVARNADKAFSLWKDGAERKNALCMFFYAQALEGGLAGKRQPDEARKWYVESARLGNATARTWCQKNNVPF